jgi:hypothetical protein
MNASASRAPVEADMSPEQSPEIAGVPPVLRRDDWFTAVILPVGAMAGVILLFTLWTTDRLMIAGYSSPHADNTVTLFGFAIGSTDIIPPAVWGIAFLVVFTFAGGVIGLLAGKGIGRLAHWRT